MKKYLLLSATLLLGGCYELATSYAKYNSDIQPVSPKNSGKISGPGTVGSLKPTLTWKDDKPVAGATYNVAVWDAFWSGGSVTQGQRVYYKEGITGTTHSIETTLMPSRHYFWSVKRSSDSDWAKMRWEMALGPNPGPGADWQPFLFKTPAH